MRTVLPRLGEYGSIREVRAVTVREARLKHTEADLVADRVTTMQPSGRALIVETKDTAQTHALITRDPSTLEGKSRRMYNVG